MINTLHFFFLNQSNDVLGKQDVYIVYKGLTANNFF